MGQLNLLDGGLKGNKIKVMHQNDWESNSRTLISRASIVLCIERDSEKQIVLRAKRFNRVRKIRCLRSIFWVLSLPILRIDFLRN